MNIAKVIQVSRWYYYAIKQTTKNKNWCFVCSKQWLMKKYIKQTKILLEIFVYQIPNFIMCVSYWNSFCGSMTNFANVMRRAKENAGRHKASSEQLL